MGSAGVLDVNVYLTGRDGLMANERPAQIEPPRHRQPRALQLLRDDLAKDD
jgi:hypothetical protein